LFCSAFRKAEPALAFYNAIPKNREQARNIPANCKTEIGVIAGRPSADATITNESPAHRSHPVAGPMIHNQHHQRSYAYRFRAASASA
jgi:hypothetical protein